MTAQYVIGNADALTADVDAGARHQLNAALALLLPTEGAARLVADDLGRLGPAAPDHLYAFPATSFSGVGRLSSPAGLAMMSSMRP